MDFQPLFDWTYTFYIQYPIFCYLLAGVLVLLTLWKPVKVLKASCLILVLAGILYICFSLIGSMNAGVNIKEKAINRTEEAIKE